MRIRPTTSHPGQAGSALVLVMIMSAIALFILGSVMYWSASSSKLTHRSIQYTRSVAAAEAATEKVVAQITHDFLNGGEALVQNNLALYQQNTVPTTSDSPYWGTWVFNDANGNSGQTYVTLSQTNSYIVLNSVYAGLKGYVSDYTIVSHASDTASPQDVTGGVLQELQLTGIPIFQFAMYSSDDMEISCGEPFTVTGRVHSNNHLYVEPDSLLTFESGVTAVVDIRDLQRHPLDTRGPPAGSVVYEQPDEKVAPVAPLTLPIGTSNSPSAIREIIEPPPSGEDPSSPLGQLRYYNESQMVLTVSDSGVSATSGEFNGFATPITNTDLALYVSTNGSFYDPREGKTVLPITIDVGRLTTWINTNDTLGHVLGLDKQTSLYVNDTRSLASTQLGAVLVNDGLVLPTNGLTIATDRPLYVQGDYNEYNSSFLGTSNTLYSRPASLVADAITVLSDNWTNGTTGPGVSPPPAAPTTINAAFLTGVVETTLGNYSGGMENFPRFIENWGSANTFTYNGSMVRMFPSKYATGVWGQANVYNPPARNWAYDINFDDPTKLPPLTPSLLTVLRTRWQTVPPGTNTVASNP